MRLIKFKKNKQVGHVARAWTEENYNESLQVKNTEGELGSGSRVIIKIYFQKIKIRCCGLGSFDA